jgi:hypothetical protein
MGWHWRLISTRTACIEVLEKLTVSLLVKTFLVFYWTNVFYVVHKSPPLIIIMWDFRFSQRRV